MTLRLRALVLVRAFTQPSALVMFFFGFSSGLPFLLVGGTLSGWLKQSGVTLDSIGLISYLSLTYSLKFVWAPLVDRLPLPVFRHFGQRRGWLLLAQCVLGLALLGMAYLTPGGRLLPFLLMVGVAAFAGATQDTVIDAYRIEIAPPEEQGALASTYTFGYRIALIASGALALVLAQQVGWASAYRVMAALLLVPIVATLVAREPSHVRRRARDLRDALQDGVIGPFARFFSRFGGWLGTWLLLFILLFKISDQMLGPIALPFYLHAGFSLVQIAEVSKVFGVMVGLAGAFAGGAAVLRWRAERCMPWALAAAAVSNLLFLLLSWHPGQVDWFIVMIIGDNFSTGLLGTVAVAFLSDLTDHRYTATQYALFSSLTVVSGKLIGGLSGVFVTTIGYDGYFIFSCLATLPALVIWWRLRPLLDRHRAAG